MTTRLGRPPGAHDDTIARLLPAALRLFLEEGGGALTPTRLAAETGMSRATLYRNWPEREDLVALLLERATLPPGDVSRSDDWRRDLEAHMLSLAERLRAKPARAFFAACLSYGQRSERARQAAQDFINGILIGVSECIEAGIRAGELHGEAAHLTSLVAGPLMLRHVLLGQSVNDQEVRTDVRSFLHAAAPTPSRHVLRSKVDNR